MSLEGLKYLMEIKPEASEEFITKRKYRYKPAFKTNPSKRKITTIIEAEIYEHKICVISFFEKGREDYEYKYNLSSNIGAGHALAIFKACLEVYYAQGQDYALVFSAANDVGEIKENNRRYTAYGFFLTRYLKDYSDYKHRGSTRVNTLMLYHKKYYKYTESVDLFYKKFEGKVYENLINS